MCVKNDIYIYIYSRMFPCNLNTELPIYGTAFAPSQQTPIPHMLTLLCRTGAARLPPFSTLLFADSSGLIAV